LISAQAFNGGIIVLNQKPSLCRGQGWTSTLILTNSAKAKKTNIQEFDALREGAFNVRYFSAEAISESVTPEGPRELIGLGHIRGPHKGC